MLGMVFVCIFAGIGLMCVLWAGFGWLLPGLEGAVLVCAGVPQQESLMRYRWLRGMGLISCPFVTVEAEVTERIPEDMERCSRKMLISRLEQEWINCHGTGTGDSSGHHRCSGISEL